MNLEIAGSFVTVLGAGLVFRAPRSARLARIVSALAMVAGGVIASELFGDDGSSWVKMVVALWLPQAVLVLVVAATPWGSPRDGTGPASGSP